VFSIHAQEYDEDTVAHGIANGTFLKVEPGLRYILFVSYLEIYNEKVYDLLHDPTTGERTALKLQEDQRGRVFAKGMREVVCYSAAQAKKLLRSGMAMRQAGETCLNADSSRSHAMLVIKLVCCPPEVTGANVAMVWLVSRRLVGENSIAAFQWLIDWLRCTMYCSTRIDYESVVSQLSISPAVSEATRPMLLVHVLLRHAISTPRS
jgi:hypothetical protein